MPDDRRAWHREGGACLFIVNLLRRGRTICSRETSVCRGAWGPPRICGAIRFAIAPYVLIATLEPTLPLLHQSTAHRQLIPVQRRADTRLLPGIDTRLDNPALRCCPLTRAPSQGGGHVWLTHISGRGDACGAGGLGVDGNPKIIPTEHRMTGITDKLPPEVAQRVHPDWRRNERSYWAKRESLRQKYEGQWIGFADDAVIASGSSPVQVLHAAQRSGKHPFVTCVGCEDTPQRMRRSAYGYDDRYPGEPLPRVPVHFRSAPGVPGLTFEDTIPGTGADASALPWTDCQSLRLDLEEGVPGLMGGVGGGSVGTIVWAAYATIDGTEYPCWLQADFEGSERIVGRDVLNRLDVLFRGPAREVVINP